MHTNISILLEHSILENWDKKAFTNYKGKTLLYKDIAEHIQMLHEIFKKYKLNKGDKISLLGCNSNEWAVVYIASMLYGTTIVPILLDFHPDDITHIINHSDSSLLFVTKNIYDTIDASSLPHIKGIFLLDNFTQTYPKEKHVSKPITNKRTPLIKNKIYNDDIAALVYTSGTTGFSKGVMLPYQSLSSNIAFAQQRLPLAPSSKILSFLPLAHAYGCSFEFLYPLTLGCHITFLGKLPSPKILVEAFHNVKPAVVLSVPLIIEKIYKKHIEPFLQKRLTSSITKIPIIKNVLYKIIRQKLMRLFGGEIIELVIGGAALNPTVEKFLSTIHFPFTLGYGMTECGPLISYSTPNEHKLGSAGKYIPWLEVKIASNDPYNEIGEIMVKGSHVMKGYYKNLISTSEILTEDGWLSTGDLGILDEDGFVFIKGRSKNMILGPSGQNIYPEEIESKLNVLPFIQESLIVDHNGQIIALIHPDLELADKENIDEQTLMKKIEEHRITINQKLPAYSQIAKIKLSFQSFEKTPTQKIKRFLYTF